jgi:hypothetical protein
MAAGYPKAPQALTPAQAASAARYAGLAQQYAQQQAPAPTYQPVSPAAAAPIPRANPLVAPQVAPATAAPVAPPPSAFQKLAPGMIGMALATGPLGVFGGFARLAAASLGNVNNPRGLGYDAATAAMNATFTPARSDLVNPNNPNGAAYGRKQSDGTVRGRTSGGTSYTSSNGGDRVSVGGKTFEKNRAGRYSQVL